MRHALVLAAVLGTVACDLSPRIHDAQVEFAADRVEYQVGEDAVMRLANRGRWTITTTECAPLQVFEEGSDWAFADPYILIGRCERWSPTPLPVDVGDEATLPFLVDDRFRSGKRYRAVITVRHGWDESTVESEAFMVVEPPEDGIDSP